MKTHLSKDLMATFANAIMQEALPLDSTCKVDGSSKLQSLTPPDSPTGSPGGVATPSALAFQEASVKQIGKKMSRRLSAGGAGTSTSVTANNRLRVYKSNSRSKWVTREIAALEFLLGVPLEAEREIVSKGWMQQQGLVEEYRIRSNDDQEGKVEGLEPPSHPLYQVPGSNSHLSTTSLSHHGRWWEKWINNGQKPQRINDAFSSRHANRSEEGELEQPPDLFNTTVDGHSLAAQQEQQSSSHPVAVRVVHAPGRRLQGADPIRVQVPILDDSSFITQQKDIARLAITREWEIKIAHGIGNDANNKGPLRNTRKVSQQQQMAPPMLDGRLFFSAAESYPLQVFSMLRYEPKKEEAIRRRQKLEARGGGGTQFFIMPVRDWRGISYRALLPAKSQDPGRHKSDDALLRFDRFASKATVRSESTEGFDASKSDANREEIGTSDILCEEDESDDSEDEDTYIPGLLDDPKMVQGRHRNVMIGDRVSGPIVSSTIQFVKPQLLKADLNKQFRDRFDGWEPPKSQRKYICARVVDGVYTLMETGTTGDDGTVSTTIDDSIGSSNSVRMQSKRQGSTSSISTGGEAKESIRMPPSLTLSKIRSMKRQVLLVAVQAKLEISTVALSIVYFERLCLDCRVDKTNRRLSFAACLLLALKMNEAHVELVMTSAGDNPNKGTSTNRLQSLIRPAKKRNNVFASLLEFFTQDWNLSLKHLFAAEWGVFAALQFRLHAKPSQVAFHYKRLLKALDWNPRSHLGSQMYSYWQDSLADEEDARIEREERRAARRKRKERTKFLQLQLELEAANLVEKEASGSHQVVRRGSEDRPDADNPDSFHGYSPTGSTGARKVARQHNRGIGSIFTRFGGIKPETPGSSESNASNTERNGDDNQPSVLHMQDTPSLHLSMEQGPVHEPVISQLVNKDKAAEVDEDTN